jgi:hypothetical protein
MEFTGNFFSLFILTCLNPINAELNPICHLVALVGAHNILHVSRVKGQYLIYNSLRTFGTRRRVPNSDVGKFRS